jgi:hypothetical protein
MMSKELLKKAGILGVTFGLVASPLAFAQEPADPADNISPDEQPVESQSSNNTGMTSDHGNQDLTHDEGDNASDMEPNSMSDDSDATYDSTEELPEENSGM